MNQCNTTNQADLHWNFLPASEIAHQAAANPLQHKILLVPADPNYSPTEDELWPAVHHAVSIASPLTPSSATRSSLPSAKSSPTTEAGEILSLTIAESKKNPPISFKLITFALRFAQVPPTP